MQYMPNDLIERYEREWRDMRSNMVEKQRPIVLPDDELLWDSNSIIDLPLCDLQQIPAER